MKKTKIVCSIGPTCEDIDTLEKMLDAGMNVARFNMSHGTHESHKAMIDTLRQARKNKNCACSVMIDTKGPEIRIKKFENGKITLHDNDVFTLTTREIVGNEKEVSVTYSNLPKILKTGNKVLLNDGNIELRVNEIKNGTDVVCRVVNGANLSNNKAINIPGIRTDMDYLSPQDISDIIFAVEMNADYISLSFVGCAQDVLDVRKLLKENGNSNIKLISKIESVEGVKNFDEILAVSDGILVARGDLGVEIEFQRVPILQKEFIKKCNAAGKVVITATQMLESMISAPRPTRAEISDVANAVLDKTTGIMLSGETASGDYPVKSVETMNQIAVEAEGYIKSNSLPIETHDTGKSLGYAAYALSETKDIEAIVVVTKNGITAENISKFHPTIPIIACTPDEKTYNRLSLCYAVLPVMSQTYTNINDINENAIKLALETNLVQKGQKILLVTGSSVETGNTLLEVKTL